MEQYTIDAVRRILPRSRKGTVDDPSLTPAAVMVLVYPKDGQLCVLLNRRSQSVAEHKGEISFPGGRSEDGDRTAVDTALRETYEEMGVRPEDVEVLGELDEAATSSNYVISPVVGTIPEAYDFKPDKREVAEVIEIPLEELTAPGALREEGRIVDGGVVVRPSYAYQGHLVYGATATLLARFLELLDNAADEEAN